VADDTEEETPSQPGEAAPALQEFQEVFTHPAAQQWAGEITTRLDDYFQRRQIADDANAAGQEFVNNVDQFKSGLVDMVQSDPHAVHTALDIVPPTMSALISNIPGGAPEGADEHHAAITGHMQSEIAAAAVTSAAESDEGTARALLNHPRIQSVLGDAAGPLSTYVDMQAAARQRDQAADAGQAQAARAELADQSARNYLGALVDPNNGKPRSPPQWNQAVLADNRVPPQDKVALFNAHEQLGRNGDAQTDPHAVMDLVNRIANGQATQRDIYPTIGSNVSLADAGTLTEAMKQPQFAQQLNDTIQSAREVIAPSGDIAETRALGRYVSWLMPQIRQGAIVDPAHEDWIGRAAGAFRVTGDDLIARPVPANRPSLSDIFAGKRMAEMAPIPIVPVNPLSPPRSSEQPIGGTESGGFFQRKVRELPPGTKAS
jgi:hypothetical protein